MILQQWEGWVVERLEDTFTARLNPTIGEGGELFAEIYMNQLPEYCRYQATPGRLFYWTVTEDDSIFGFMPRMAWPGEALREAMPYDLDDAIKRYAWLVEVKESAS